MEKEKIVIELCGGRMPEKAHDADAAYDVFTKEDTIISDWNRYAIPLGFKIQLPKHLAAVIQPRSGMSSIGMYAQQLYEDGFTKEVRIDADVKLGLIDSGYTGEVTAIVKTFGIGSYLPKNIIIPAGTRIAQMRIVEIPNTELVSGVIKKEENDDKENNDKKRGDNGFNSSGVK
jgi:dUTP pyrophosphatase